MAKKSTQDGSGTEDTSLATLAPAMEAMTEQATDTARLANIQAEIVRLIDEARSVAIQSKKNLPSKVGQLLKAVGLDTPYIKGESALLGKREKESMTDGQKALWDCSKNICHKKDVLIHSRSKSGVSEVPVIRQVESFFDSILVVLAD